MGHEEARQVIGNFPSFPPSQGDAMQMGFNDEEGFRFKRATFAFLDCKKKARSLIKLNAHGGDHSVAVLRAVSTTAWEESKPHVY